MLASVALLALVTVWWKISIHCAVASGSVAILAFGYGPLVLPGYLLVALLAWARVAAGDHTVAQVVAGALLGAGSGALAFGFLTSSLAS
jgi:membrane-associated phospholipid phosphatase